MSTNDETKALIPIYNDLNDTLSKQVNALPKDFNRERFIQNCMTVLQDGKADFSHCESRSVVRTLLKGAYLGLDFFNGECYAIPYGNTCNFQTDYKGCVKLAKRYASNPIKDIYAKVVREGDEFTENINDGKQSVSFSPIPFNNGDIKGAFAVCLYKDGSMIYDTMSKEDIEKTRTAFSKASTSKAWKDAYGEMCKKTVLRRLCKMIDLNFDTADQVQAYADGDDFDVDKANEPDTYKAKDIYADAKVVDPEPSKTDDEVEAEAKELFK